LFANCRTRPIPRSSSPPVAPTPRAFVGVLPVEVVVGHGQDPIATSVRIIGSAVPTPPRRRTRAGSLEWARTADVDVFTVSALDDASKATREGQQGTCWGVWDRLGTINPTMLPLRLGTS
jgi:hypothetical protein